MKEYLDILQYVLDTGVENEFRTNSNALQARPYSYSIDISEKFPLLTTKKMAIQAASLELCWYLSGEEHIKNFRELSFIWDKWEDAEGRLESAYGRFWRRYPHPHIEDFLDGEQWNNKWIKKERRSISRDGLLGKLGQGAISYVSDLESAPRLSPFEKLLKKGIQKIGSHLETKEVDVYVVDQVQYVRDILQEVKTNPTISQKRRMIINAWHPGNAMESMLPPCHDFIVFQLRDNELNCHLTQRSGDVPVGIPFNIACYSMLTHMFAKDAEIKPGSFSHTIVDPHIYMNQIQGVYEQLSRTPGELPTLEMCDKPFEKAQELWQAVNEAPKEQKKKVARTHLKELYTLHDYNPQKKIQFEVEK